jgi:hypothetical protein
MNRLFLLVALAALIALGVVLYRRHYSTQLDVEPHAAKEIRKAQHR